MDKVLTQKDLNEAAEDLRNIHTITEAAKYLAGRRWSPDQMTLVLQDEKGNFLSSERCLELVRSVSIDFTPSEVKLLKGLFDILASWRGDELADNREAYEQLLSKIDYAYQAQKLFLTS